MKKSLIMLAIIGFGVATLCSCGSSPSSSKDSEDTKGLSKFVIAEDYRKACELKEFSIAYEIIDKLKKEKGENVSDEAEKYVVLQEALFVLESKGIDGIMRIVGIAKEHNAEGWLYIELLDVAKKMGDTDLANRIENIIQSTINNLSTISLTDISLINYLAETKDEKNSEAILGLLSKEEKNIPTKPMIGKIDTKDWYDDEVCDPYTKAVKKYNDQCSMILNIAIKHGNQYLAKRSLSKIKTNIKCIELPSTSSPTQVIYHYNITNDNEDIKSANAAYQDAVRSGAFK